jgi:hypothetical protein
VSAAAGMKDSNKAASIMMIPADILDFMTYSLVNPLTCFKPYRAGLKYVERPE